LAIWETEDFNDGCRTYAEVAGVIDDPDSASNVPCLILVLAFKPHWHTLPQDRGE